jgi:tetratricopeptide (TPR) repeat protein
MEILKKILVFVAFILVTNTLSAQYSQEVIDVFKQSYKLENDGEYSKAIRLVKDIYNEDSYEINVRLGWLTYLQGLFSESIPYYQRCLSIRPLSTEARLGIANPASSMGNWDLVEKMYLEILENEPSNSLVNYRMGVIYYGRDDFNTAFKYLEKVVNHYPFDYDSVIMLAWTNYKLGKYREAKVLFNKALLITPDDPSALEGLEYVK